MNPTQRIGWCATSASYSCSRWGAGLGSKSAAQLGGRAIWLSCCFLLVSFTLMFIREELEENPVIEKDLTAIRQETREIDRTLKQELQEEQRELTQSARK